MLAFTIKEKEEWAYEKEWRLFTHYNENSYPFRVPKAKAVYAGEKMENVDLKLLKGVCSDLQVPIFQMEENNSGFVPVK